MIKRILIVFVVLIITLLILAKSLVEFRISDNEAKTALQESGHTIHFQDVKVEDQTIHYAFTDNSKDFLIVFVHGSPGSWNAFIDYFKADSLLQYVDMVSIDRAGFGESNFGDAEPSLEMQAKHLKAVTDQFDHRNKVLIGHSLGGPVIARAAMDYPNSFGGLIMVAPSVDPDMEKDEWYRGAINTYLGEVVTPIEFQVSNNEILPLKEELTKMLPLWEKIQIPTIVIQGTGDRLVPKENAYFVQKMLPEPLLEVVMLEGVNHFIPWNNSDEIIKAIQQMSNGLQVSHP